jgi:long-chain acyl-CoA synthetase
VSFASLDEAAARGMSLAWQASQHPERTAIFSAAGDCTFALLNERVNRVAHALRAAGLQPGDGVALLCMNRTEFAEVFFATQRSGLRLTPINWHMRPEEVAYVAADCGARALLVDARFPEASALAAEQAGAAELRLAIGGSLPGYGDYEAAIADASGEDVSDPRLGDTMLYTSGTTGRPKGVRRAMPDPEKAVLGYKLLSAVFDFRPDEADVALATGPLYHSGPINLCLAIPINHGIPTYLMEKWDAERMLGLISKHRVTHTFCVPTMFRRLLALPDEVRSAADLSTLRFVIHGAAPTPVEDKQAIIEWLGPIVTEIYAATEGMGCLVSSAEWLARPGTVGRPSGDIRIVDEQGEPVPRGSVGTVFLQPVGGGDFEYHGDTEKTAGAKRDGYFTVGDLGYLDDEGYLFLTGRSAEVIISGGTNIYPAEIDAVLLRHPAVRDGAAVGVPDAEWGEVVKAVVALEADATPGDALAEEILAHCKSELATYKTPRNVDFVEEIPRSEAGKIVRRELRDRYRT